MKYHLAAMAGIVAFFGLSSNDGWAIGTGVLFTILAIWLLAL